VSKPLRSKGPLYKTEPLDGWYAWYCPVCNVRQEDRESTHSTSCANEHLVSLNVVGTEADGFRIVAEVDRS